MLEGVVGRLYRVEASSDLVTWSELGTVENTEGAFDFVDRAGDGQSHRFYRAVPVN